MLLDNPNACQYLNFLSESLCKDVPSESDFGKKSLLSPIGYCVNTLIVDLSLIPNTTTITTSSKIGSIKLN